MIPTKYQNESKIITDLFEWGDPLGRDGDYSERDWEDYLYLGFTEADVPVLITLLANNDLHNAPDERDDLWVSLYAWRILGQLKSEAAIQPLFDLLEGAGEDYYTWNEVPVALGMIGKPVMKRFSDLLVDKSTKENFRLVALEGLIELVKHHPEHREEAMKPIQEYMNSPIQELDVFNGLLVASLLDIKAVELIDDIRVLYELDCVDQTIPGDLEDAEIALGLRDKRITPKPDYKALRGEPGFEDLRALFGRADQSGAADPYYLRSQITPEPFVRDAPKVGRNDPCPCGSGKKYKKCCMNK